MHKPLSANASRCTTAFAVVAVLLAGPTWAHHPMGGAVPATLWEGLLSGFGHPVIELDHLLFLLGVSGALALARATPGRAGAWLVAYAIAGVAGTAWRVPGASIPMAEVAIAVSLLVVALWLWTRRMPGATVGVPFAAAAGFFHGYAYGEAVIGAELRPLAAYLCGLAVVQSLMMMGIFYLMRHMVATIPARLSVSARAVAVLIGAAGLWALWTARLGA